MGFVHNFNKKGDKMTKAELKIVNGELAVLEVKDVLEELGMDTLAEMLEKAAEKIKEGRKELTKNESKNLEPI